MTLEPVLVDGLCIGVAVRTIEEDDTLTVRRSLEQLQQVILRSARLGEDDGLTRRPQTLQFRKGLFQGSQKGLAFGIVTNAGGQFDKLT